MEFLTQSELDSAYQIVSENDFFAFSETFECNKSKEYTLIGPNFTSIMIVKAYGKTKKVTYSSYCSPKEDLESERKFMIITKKLSELLNRKDRIKNLPKTQMVFL